MVTRTTSLPLPPLFLPPPHKSLFLTLPYIYFACSIFSSLLVDTTSGPLFLREVGEPEKSPFCVSEVVSSCSMVKMYPTLFPPEFPPSTPPLLRNVFPTLLREFPSLYVYSKLHNGNFVDQNQPSLNERSFWGNLFLRDHDQFVLLSTNSTGHKMTSTRSFKAV